MNTREPWVPPFPDGLRPLFAEQGLGLVAVADAEALPDREARFRRWIERGSAGGMEWLARAAPLRYAPAKILPGCRSIVVAALNYYQETQAAAPNHEAPSGRIARYAWGRDYHKSLGQRLRSVVRALERRWPNERFAAAVDATPLAERAYAERAGIGFCGRNTLLISSRFGSWIVLGEILSTLRFAPSGGCGDRHGACPPDCRRCIEACPTRALAGPQDLDASRCISYLTIEHKGSIPADLRPLIGDWLFGCDLCQEACPLNARAPVTDVEDFTRLKAGARQPLARILALGNRADVAAAFAGSPLARSGRRGLVRNACVVAANAGAADLLPELRRLSRDADPVVAEHAAWAAAALEAGFSRR